MLPLKLRKRILNKLAQAVPGAPASPASPTSPTSPNAPTEPVSTTAQAIPPAPDFNVVSGPWAWVGGAYNSPTVGFLTTIMSMVNTVLHYSTQGKYNLSKNQNNIGSLDSSSTGTADGKNAVLLAQLLYKTFINNGQAIMPTATQINTWADSIVNSQPLMALSQLNPTGQASQQMRLPDSFRQTIVNNLGYIKQYNPVQPQQQR